MEIIRNYYKISPDAQPFLHYWSLSVEEQYYLVFPATLLILYKFSQSPRNIKRTILVVAAISAFLSMYFTKSYPVAAFYLLPTRAWELLAGASVSLIRFYSADNKTVSSVFYLEIVVGFLLIIVSFFIFHF